MSRLGTRLLATLVAALLATALLSACGGSDSSTDSTATGADVPTSKSEAKARLEEQVAKRKKGREEEGKGQPKSGKKGNGESPGSGGGSGNSKSVTAPLEVSGGGSGQFRSKGGDNSIQEYGDEAGESELREVAEIVHDFYVARVEKRWDKACTYLSKGNVEQLEKLAARSGQQNVDCGTVLKAFTRTLPPSVEREITTVDARSFRHDSEQGFLIYYGAGKVAYAMPVRAEDGTWKVTALVGTTLG